MTVSGVLETVNALAVVFFRPASCHLNRRSTQSRNCRNTITRAVAHHVSRNCVVACIRRHVSEPESSALEMDLPDESFDVALCQQGLQFFPDQLKALQETNRVLRAGGRARFNIWAGAGPFNKAVGAAVAKHIDDATGKRFCESRNVPGADTLRALFSDAGFEQVEVTREQMEIRLPDIRAFVLAQTQGTPIAADVNALSEVEQSGLASDAAERLSQYADGLDVVVPDFCNVVSSSK